MPACTARGFWKSFAVPVKLAPANGFGGAFSMNRFHVSDPIPFDKSLRFDFEIWHWTDTAIAIDATLYWYARPGGKDDFQSAAAAADSPRPAAR